MKWTSKKRQQRKLILEKILRPLQPGPSNRKSSDLYQLSYPDLRTILLHHTDSPLACCLLICLSVSFSLIVLLQSSCWRGVYVLTFLYYSQLNVPINPHSKVPQYLEHRPRTVGVSACGNQHRAVVTKLRGFSAVGISKALWDHSVEGLFNCGNKHRAVGT